MKKIIASFILILFLSNKAFATVDNYIQKAKELELYNDPQWERLLHYKKNIFGSHKSMISNADFFISKNGRYDKKDEMIETIKAFYQENDKEETEKYQHPICRFPARLQFLNEKLNFKNLPKVQCKRYNEFMDEISPQGLSIIFPTAYINNPASMFGHTLIRIDREKKFSGNIDINSIIINYGANTHGETSGIIYAFNGVFGFYKGFFSAMPYYKMVNDYSNLENRDIWEYKLNYSKDEAIFYSKHMWELMFADINYYFFKENCSYLMLETLDVIRPNDNLTSNFLVYTAPLDTIKILNDKNIVLSEIYRPSLQKQIQYNSKNINNSDKKLIKKYIKAKDTTPEFKDNLSYLVAYNFLQYKKVKGEVSLQDYRKKSVQLLKKINTNENESAIDKEKPTSPLTSHKIGKGGISFGRYNNENYLQLSYKPSYHELTDDKSGFDNSSEISFFNTELKYFTESKKLELEKLDFIKIKSLPPQDSFFKPMSFSVLFGINNLYNDNKVLLLDVNGGITFGNEIFSAFFLIGPKINYSGTFDNNFNLGFNNVNGFLINGNYLKTIFEFKINKLINSEYNYNQLTIDNNIIITKNFLFNIKYQKYFYNQLKNRDDISIGIKVLF